MAKNLILDLIYARWAQIRAVNITRYHGQLSSCTISEKTNDPILRKFSDGRTCRQSEESDFLGHCPTNVERPKDEETKYDYINMLKEKSTFQNQQSYLSWISLVTTVTV